MTFKQKDNYTFEELLECGHGRLFGEGNAQLPLPPFLMLDRISTFRQKAGSTVKARLRQSWISNPTCGFSNAISRTTPSCRGAWDWTPCGNWSAFFSAGSAGSGAGRAISVGEVKFSGQVLDTAKEADVPNQPETCDHAKAGHGHRRWRYECRQPT